MRGCLQEKTQLEAAIKVRNLPGGGIGRTLRVMHAREVCDPEWRGASPQQYLEINVQDCSESLSHPEVINKEVLN